ncbi:dephospho-CoA kinase [Caldicellulosiruptoraceae bacterium PP1]
MKQNKLIIGITGLVGSGKSLVSKYLETLGFYYINVDAVYHEMLISDISLKKQLIEAFGTKILNNDMIDRNVLRNIVLSNDNNFELLNKITHPKIYIKVSELIKSIDGNIVIEAAILFQTGLNKLCTHVWYIDSQKEIIIERIKQRNNLEERIIRSLLKKQEYIEQTKFYCDVIIKNDNSIENLYAQINLTLMKEAE